jgi:hypothetical protein
MAKDNISSPFEHALVPEKASGTKSGDTVNRNACPYFDKPRDTGAQSEPEVFFSGVNGKDYHGSITGKDDISSPMGNTRKGK